MTAQVVRLVPPKPIPKAEVETQTKIPERVSAGLVPPALVDFTNNSREYPLINTGLLWKIPVAITIGLISLVMLIVAAFVIGSKVNLSELIDYRENHVESSKVAPLLPSINPPPLPYSLHDTPSQKQDKKISVIYEPKKGGAMSGGANKNKEKRDDLPPGKTRVSTMEITDSSGLVTVHKIGKVEKFIPKDNSNVQE